MKVFIVLCIALLFLSGCGINQMPNTQPIPNSAKANNEGRYLRITLKSPSMGKDELPYFINDDTSVHIKTEKEFSTQMPIYEIKPHYISGADFQKMQENLEIKEHDRAWWCKLELDKNTVTGTIAPFDDIERGYYANLQWTDEELEEHAWEVFNKIPFLEGEYSYAGITGTDTIWSINTGEIVTRVSVSFLRLVDGVRVTGYDSCVISFDGSGFVAMNIQMFDYKQIGTMDLVPLEDAQARIKTPDSFSFKSYCSSKTETLEVDGTDLYLVNQYHRGCTILQPVYNFSGTATLEDGTESRFSSQVIAIPESYTYEKSE